MKSETGEDDMKRSEENKEQQEQLQRERAERINEMVKNYARVHKERNRQGKRGDLHFV